MKEPIIKHQGIICGLDAGMAKIKLLNVSACSSCHAKAGCGVSETDNKVVEVPVAPHLFSKGDKVTVLFNDSLGVKALLLGYMFPFFVMLVALFTVWAINKSEIQAGLAALLILIPYYLILSLYKKRLRQTFSFKLEKTDTKI